MYDHVCILFVWIIFVYLQYFLIFSEGLLTFRSEVAKHGYKGQTWAAWTKENMVAKPATFAVGKLWSALGYNTSQLESLAPGEKYVCLEALKVILMLCYICACYCKSIELTLIW